MHSLERQTLMEDLRPQDFKEKSPARARAEGGAVPPAPGAPESSGCSVTQYPCCTRKNSPKAGTDEDDLVSTRWPRSLGMLGEEAREALQEPLTLENGNIKPDPNPTKTATLPPAGAGAEAAVASRLPEKRAYACLSCSNAEVAFEAKIPKQAAKVAA
ncbi:hypothetical protein AAY473_040676 [Plecturocebus cupreus]